MSDDRELVERLAAIEATPRANWVAELRADLDAAWESGDTAFLTLVDPELTPTQQPTGGRRWPIVIAAAVVVLVVSALVLVTRDDGRKGLVPAAPPVDAAAEYGLIAFSGTSGESTAESDTDIFQSGADIYVVAPDGTGLRALTSTPGVSEMAPRWSPDGTRLAFLRHAGFEDNALVVIDPSTGRETFSADIPMDSRTPPMPPEWSPDGRFIYAGQPVVELETNTWTEVPGGTEFHGWSPDGRWFVLSQDETLFLVPADLLGTTDLDDVSNLPGVRPLLPQPENVVTGVTWLPDSSAVAISLFPDRSIDVVTIADGQRRTLIESGGNPSWSPDGSQIAYLQCLGLPDDVAINTVPADMADVDPMRPDATVWVATADGTGARPIATSLAPPIWSPDGSLLIAVGDDGLFTVRPDGNAIGSGITRLTRSVTPRTMNVACTQDVGGPVWQPMSPSAETVADALSPDRVVTTEVAVTTEPSATTEASATTDG